MTCVCGSGRAPSGAGSGKMLRCAALALLCAALVHADRERRAEISPVPFVMGSRYGRSPERAIAPRNDRFFMGSRYGKRSGMDEEGGGVQGLWEGCENSGTGAPCRRLVCRFAGEPNFYQCVRRQDLSVPRRDVSNSRAGESDD